LFPFTLEAPKGTAKGAQPALKAGNVTVGLPLTVTVVVYTTLDVQAFDKVKLKVYTPGVKNVNCGSEVVAFPLKKFHVFGPGITVAPAAFVTAQLKVVGNP
jgi:hypothetical protein